MATATRKNQERITRRFVAYRDHLRDQVDVFRRRRRIVNNVVGVFIAPTPQDVMHLRQTARPILDERSWRDRPLILFWPASSWWQDVTLSRRQHKDDQTERHWTVRGAATTGGDSGRCRASTIDTTAQRLIPALVPRNAGSPA